mmetsp:Transcript_4606/g.3766  ORF Transcript_4606/g.3766 Transcript_4606/m.3766 type:complete len:85 (+) Transcript_4606:120-374(+)
MCCGEVEVPEHCIIVNIVGAITTNLGTVLMKYHTAVKHGKGHSLIIGLILFCIGSILTFGSFAFAPQSLLSLVNVVAIVPIESF